MRRYSFGIVIRNDPAAGGRWRYRTAKLPCSPAPANVLPRKSMHSHSSPVCRVTNLARVSCLASLISLAAIATSSCSDDDAPITGPIAATVMHYDYKFDLTTRAAAVIVSANVTTAGDCFSLPFRSQNVQNATWNGLPVEGTVANGALALCGPGVAAGTTLELGATMDVAAATLGPSQVGFSTKNDREGHPFTYLVSWVGGCDQFGPCDSRPDQFATYKFTVTHAAGVTVRCPGTITETSPTETVCDFAFPGGPTYSTFGVVATNGWTVTERGMWGPLKVTLYDRPATKIASKIDNAYQTGFVNWMISQFGPFPYGTELRILTGPTYWGGFEHPGNIVLADNLATQFMPSYADQTQHTLDHEIVHQWAGDQTTLKDTYDFVWKEAMAEYLTYVYEDMQLPAVAKVTAAAWKGFSGPARYFPVPGDKPKLFDYYGDVYGPGPMVLFRQIEVLSSRQKVIAAIATLLGKPRALSVDEVIAALTLSTGLDLTEYTNAWIKGSGRPTWPTFTTVFTPAVTLGEMGTLAVNQTNTATAGNRRCAFHVELRGANPGDVVSVLVDTFRNGTAQNLLVATPAFAVTSTVLDPGSECLVYNNGIVHLPLRRAPWVAAE